MFSSLPGNELDRGLTPLGQRQVREAAEKAKQNGLHFDKIVCSTLTRARESAAIYADVFDYPVSEIECLDELIELQFGVLEGTSWSAYWQSGKTYADLGDYEGAETIEDLQNRAASALIHLRSLADDSILVVAHSAFGRALLRVIQDKPYTDEFIVSKRAKSLPHGEALKFI